MDGNTIVQYGSDTIVECEEILQKYKFEKELENNFERIINFGCNSNIQYNVIKILISLRKLLILTNEIIELRVNSEYFLENENRDIIFMYAQFSIYYKSDLMVIGLINIYGNMENSLNKICKSIENNKKLKTYLNKIDKIKKFKNVVFIDDFVKMLSGFIGKIKLIQKNYALADSFILNKLKQGLQIKEFFIELADNNYEKGLFNEVLKNGQLIKIDNQNLKFNKKVDMSKKKNKTAYLKFEISKFEINGEVIFVNFFFKVMSSTVAILHKNKVIKFLTGIDFRKLSKKYNWCENISLNLRRYILAKMENDSDFVDNKINLKVKINRKFKNGFCLKNLKQIQSINKFFNTKHFVNLSYALLYLIEEKLGTMPLIILDIQLNN